MKGDLGANNYASFADNHGFYDDSSKTSPYFYPFPVDLGRKKLNMAAIIETILLPWVIFAAVMWLLSFDIHYDHANQCYFLIAALALIGLCFAVKGSQLKGLPEQEQRHDPKWYMFLAAFCTGAWLLGIVLGMANYGISNSYYHYRDLNMVTNLDPASSGAQEFLDASTVSFVNTARVDQEMSLGYKDGTLYCVAPITTGDTPYARYDFWAVGKDCCNAFGGSFTCGSAVDDPDAHAGLRLMSDGDRPYYKLAVSQAQSQYKIQAPTPLFFEWVKDPEKEKNDYLHEAQAFFWTAALVTLMIHSIIVACTAMMYDKKLERGEF